MRTLVCFDFPFAGPFGEEMARALHELAQVDHAGGPGSCGRSGPPARSSHSAAAEGSTSPSASSTSSVVVLARGG